MTSRVICIELDSSTSESFDKNLNLIDSLPIGVCKIVVCFEEMNHMKICARLSTLSLHIKQTQYKTDAVHIYFDFTRINAENSTFFVTEVVHLIESLKDWTLKPDEGKLYLLDNLGCEFISLLTEELWDLNDLKSTWNIFWPMRLSKKSLFNLQLIDWKLRILPSIYGHLKEFLNQDICNIVYSYLIIDNFDFEKLYSDIEFKKMLW